MPDFLIKFASDNKAVVIPEGKNILYAILAVGISFKASCGGKGTCSRCKVLLKEGKVNSSATGKLTEEELAAGYVLACQSIPESDLIIEIPEESQLSEHQMVLDDPGERFAGGETYAKGLLAEGNGLFAQGFCEPLYRKVKLKILKPSLDDPEDDLGRLLRTLHQELGIEHLRLDLDTIRSLPHVLRKAGWEVIVHLTEAAGYRAIEIEEIEPVQADKKYYGLAVDIGTTTVVVHLVDLETGVSLGVKGTYNRQAIFGDDVISRIIYADEHPNGLQELQRAVMSTINELIDNLKKAHRISHADVRAAVCAGNTTMTHLFLGLKPTYIRLEPYVPVANNIPAVRAHRLGLKIYPRAWVQCVPGIASYVGGDITAGVLITGMAEREEMTLFIDVGTNGEMVLGNKEWLIACSCSAGPAFEGSGIRDGMRAMKGAIEFVDVADEGVKVEYRTIGNVPPVGICGSGLIDCLASLSKSGVIDRAGNFVPGLYTRRLRKKDDEVEFVLSWAENSGRGKDIAISEPEIKNLIRSKAAVFAGVRSMLTMVGLPLKAIERIFIAGGFGRHINIQQAIAIGMFPDLGTEKYTYIGNSSVKGAKLALLSQPAREKLQELAGHITYLELSGDNTFYEEFVSALFLPHTDLSLFPSLL